MNHQTIKRHLSSFRVIDLLPLTILLVYVFMAPFNKVEESFNLQSTHDLLYCKTLDCFDHHQFPGVVPRTFIGPLVLTIFSFPFKFLFNKYQMLYLVRCVLGLMTWLSLTNLRSTIDQVISKKAGTFFVFLTSTQFHLLFYSSRTLPNTFALILSIYSISALLRSRIRKSFTLMVLGGIIFRCDLIVLFVPLSIYALILRRKILMSLPEIPKDPKKQVNKTILYHHNRPPSAFNLYLRIFSEFLIWSITPAISGIVLSFLIDSFFWKKAIWPEGVVLLYNTVQNKSSNWGTSPFYWYFARLIPKAILNSLPIFGLSIFCFPKLKKSPATHLAIVAIVYIFLYSFLPHKELRFVFPAIPLFNTFASAIWSYCLDNKEKEIQDINSNNNNHNNQNNQKNQKSQKNQKNQKNQKDKINQKKSKSIKNANQTDPKIKTKSPKKFFSYIVLFVGYCSIFVGIMITLSFLFASINNYPGGKALLEMNSYLNEQKLSYKPFLHIGVYAAETGVSRFLELPNVTYSKKENLQNNQLLRYSHLITEISNLDNNKWTLIKSVQGFNGIDIKTFLKSKNFSDLFSTKDVLFLYEKK
ncbi:Dol-P-Man:Man(7)GlcNAc(2)-PP-Dol alpha-1,6-mannosyltransferase [Anaeramoeba flamelloides]|uniref:Mannosyltransferase n=1 Tax=Anaeramoeba flamelloides TaxID=1746091 RepID=A0ABQ8XK23_9EUKA|nr:Dol-P-Man:Man(7)GlcNAc(2)-PP-Dol alpha-1,6-mannosyltransferase [Anaeramoeba flamelloides]